MYLITSSEITVEAFSATQRIGYVGDSLGLLAKFQRNNSVSRSQDGVSVTLNSGYCYNPEGADVPTGQTRSFTLLVKEEKNSNPKFRERMSDGEVVVSPYLVDRMTVIEEQSLSDDRKYGGITDHRLKNPRTGKFLFEELGLTYSVSPYHLQNLGDYRLLPTDGTYWYQIGIQFYYTDTPSLSWPSPLDYELLTRPFVNASANVPFLQGIVSKAYTKAVDALTSLAEAPETVGTIYSVLKTAGNLFINRKKAIEDIKEAYKHRGELIKKAFEFRMLVITGQHPRTQRAISRQNRAITKARKDLVRDLKKNSIGLTSALASAWLSFRYAIMPNVYLVRDIIKAEKNLGMERVNTSGQISEALTPEPASGCTVSGSRTRYHKAWCQLSLRVDSPLSRLRSVTSFDILVTAWELVPLSFVVDWFVNVGNALSVLTPPSDAKSVGITYSFKDVSNLTYIHANGAKTTIMRESYKRSVMSTEDFSGLHLNVQLNWKRALDAGALLWNISIKKRLKY